MFSIDIYVESEAKMFNPDVTIESDNNYIVCKFGEVEIFYMPNREGYISENERRFIRNAMLKFNEQSKGDVRFFDTLSLPEWQTICENAMYKFNPTDVAAKKLIDSSFFCEKYYIGIRFIRDEGKSRVNIARHYWDYNRWTYNKQIMDIDFGYTSAEPSEVSHFIGQLMADSLNRFSSIYKFSVSSTTKSYDRIWDTSLIVERKPYLPPF